MTRMTALGSLAGSYASAAAESAGCAKYDYAWTELLADNPYGNCSSHGECVGKWECVCEWPWTGRSDIINTEGLDCQVNEVAIRALWGFNMLFCITLTALSLPKFRQRFADHRENVKEKAAMGKSVSIFSNRGLIAQIAYLFLVVPGLVSMGIVRNVDPSQRIGVTWAMTIFFFLTRLGFYALVFAFQPALLGSLLKGKHAKKMRYLVQVTEKGVLICCIGSVVCSALPFILVAFPQQDPTSTLARTIWYSMMGGIAVNLFAMAAVAAYVKKKVIREMNRSYKIAPSERSLKLRDALVQGQNAAMRQSIVQGSLYVVLCAYPFCYNKHDYWLPVSLLSYTVIGFALARTILAKDSSRDQTATSSSRHSSANESKSSKSTFQVSTAKILSTQIHALSKNGESAVEVPQSEYGSAEEVDSIVRDAPQKTSRQQQSKRWNRETIESFSSTFEFDDMDDDDNYV